VEQTDVLGETLRIVEEWLGQKPEFGPIRVELTVAEADGWGFPDLLRSALPEVEVREGEVEGAPKPAVEVEGGGGGSTVFAGYPLLYEMAAFLTAVWDRSLEEHAARRVLSMLEEKGFRAAPGRAEREAYLLVTPECPYCPRMAVALASASRLVPGARYFIVDAYDDALLEFFVERSGVAASAAPLLVAGEEAYVGAPRGGLASAAAFALAVLRIVDADPVEAAKAVAGKG
jgi:hypothetical protein